MGYIRLHPADCKKYGAPEEIPFSLTSIGTRQRGAFEKSPDGPRKPWRWLLDQIGGVPELDDAGNPIPVPVIDDESGEQVRNEDGTPKVTEKLTRHPDTFAMLAWIALWGEGIRVPWEKVDPATGRVQVFDVREVGLQLNLLDEEDAGGDPGKADQPETGSESSTTNQ